MKTRSETVVRECLVGLCHTMHIFALSDRAAATLRRVGDFTGQTQNHRLFAALACVLYQPAHSQSPATLRTNFDRNLIGCTTYPAGLYFHHRSNGVERL